MIDQSILDKAFEFNKHLELSKSETFSVDAHIKIADLSDEVNNMCDQDEELANWYFCLALNLHKENYELAEHFRNKILNKGI